MLYSTYETRTFVIGPSTCLLTKRANVNQGRQCREELKAQHVGNALYGLQSLGDSAELRGLVAALTPKVQQSKSRTCSRRRFP